MNTYIADQETIPSNFVMQTPKYSEFLKERCIAKDDKTTKPTNARMCYFVDEKTNNKYFPGKYNIQKKDYNRFLDLYYKEIILKGKEETLIEIQLMTDTAPFLVDIDFRFEYELQKRLFNKKDVEDIIEIYLSIFKTIHQFSPDDIIEVFVMTKPNINHVIKGENKYVKDGIHIIIGLQCNHMTQEYIRSKVIEHIRNTPPAFWENTPPTNSLESIFDKGISKGICPWQLYGSKKSVSTKEKTVEAYEITYLYTWKYDMETDTVIQTEIPLNTYNLQQNFYKLSARYENHPPLFTNNFYDNEIAQFAIDNAPPPPAPAIPQNSLENMNAYTQRYATGGISFDIQNPLFSPKYILEMKSIEELDQYIMDVFIDNPNMDMNIKEIIEYVFILPESYWGTETYDAWIRVGWALYNQKTNNNELFGIWVKFSSQMNTFHWNDVKDLYDRWMTFKIDKISKRSIIYWAKKDAPEKYAEIKKKYNNSHIDYLLSRFESLADVDYANIVLKLNKHKFICACVKEKLWYEFKNHRWMNIDNSASIIKCVGKDLRDLFCEKGVHIEQIILENKKKQMSYIQEDSDEPDTILKKEELIKEIKILEGQSKKVNAIIKFLGTYSNIKNILNYCMSIFYESTFLNTLDSNRDLLCFKNGVLDLKEKIFRDGLPQDYISKCTNIDYFPLCQVPQYHVDFIGTFMDSIFPDKELCTYMWEHLASSISGRIHNQAFYYYIGEGSNGKSVLTDLMMQILGDYAKSPPISLITEEQSKHGSADPYLHELQGVRYACAPEPSKGKSLKEGLMKQLTSGIDIINTRAMYKTPISFQPHLTLVVCANQFLKIDSQDEGTWRRIQAIPFLSKFCDNPDKTNRYQFKKDLNMSKTLQEEYKESFMAMLVDVYFHTDGVVQPCQIVINKSKEYRNNEDIISQFIDDYIQVVPEEDINPLNILYLKQGDVSFHFNIFKLSCGDNRKYNIKDVCDAISKRFPNNKCYAKNNKTVQWKHLFIPE